VASLYSVGTGRGVPATYREGRECERQPARNGDQPGRSKLDRAREATVLTSENAADENSAGPNQ